jgi:hypothetical protein
MQLVDGQTLIDRLTYEGIAVTAGAWVKESESGDWYLYLATPLVSADGGTRPAYRRINTVIRKMEKEGFGMDLLAIKVIGPHDPIATDMLAHRAGPARTPTRFRGSRLGNLDIDEAYVYAPPPTPEELTGMQLWECGRTELRPGIGPAGLCRMVVIDLQTQAVIQRKTYRGAMDNPQSRRAGQLEVTWSEGGAVRIIGGASGQRWRWSQSRGIWEEGGCPPDEVLQAIFTAMG